LIYSILPIGKHDAGNLLSIPVPIFGTGKALERTLRLSAE